MTDYKCPSCGGGFPAPALDDECPWCGKAMDGRESSSGVVPTVADNTTGIGGLTGVRSRIDSSSFDSTPEPGDSPLRRSRIEPRVKIQGLDSDE